MPKMSSPQNDTNRGVVCSPKWLIYTLEHRGHKDLRMSRAHSAPADLAKGSAVHHALRGAGTLVEIDGAGGRPFLVRYDSGELLNYSR